MPTIESALLGFFVALFAGAYAWLALQPNIDRPLVGFAAIGKAGVFVLALAFWIFGEAPGRLLFFSVGDLIFAAIFCWWLTGSDSKKPAG